MPLGGWLANPPGWLIVPVIAGIVIIGLSFAGHQVFSWRAAEGDRRQQLKWLACGGAVAAVSLILAAVLGVAGLLAGLAALPVSIGMGILRYRRYDIDRIISRTLAYALVTGMLAGVYAGLVLLATRGPVVPFPGGGGGGHAGCGGAVQPVARAGAASGGPAVQPGPV